MVATLKLLGFNILERADGAGFNDIKPLIILEKAELLGEEYKDEVLVFISAFELLSSGRECKETEDFTENWSLKEQLKLVVGKSVELEDVALGEDQILLTLPREVARD